MAASWLSETLYFDGDAYYADLLRGIDSARRSIIFETYIFDPDDTGKTFEEALTRAAARGVRVQVLVDGIGAGAWVDGRARTLASNGVEVRVYHPVKLASLFRRLLIDVGVRRKIAGRSSYLLARLNRRNHRKMLITDESKAWVGSLNVSNVHSRKYLGSLAWRDTGVCVEGEEIRALLSGFDYAWIRAHSLDGRRTWSDRFTLPKRSDAPRSSLVRTNYTLRLRRSHFAEFSRRLRRARTRIWITNAYLAPSKPVLRGLQQAARRGVDVRILVPRKSDVFFMPWVSASFYGTLLDANVKIFEFRPRFLHAKSVLIDDWCAVGTSNLNRRSLLKDFEVDVVLGTAKSRQSLETQFERDLTESSPIQIAPTGVKAWLGRIIIYFMKRWI